MDNTFLLCFPVYTLNVRGTTKKLVLELLGRFPATEVEGLIAAMPLFTDRPAAERFLSHTGFECDLCEHPTPPALSAFLAQAMRHPGGAERWLLIDPLDAQPQTMMSMYTVGHLLRNLLAT